MGRGSARDARRGALPWPDTPVAHGPADLARSSASSVASKFLCHYSSILIILTPSNSPCQYCAPLLPQCSHPIHSCSNLEPSHVLTLLRAPASSQIILGSLGTSTRHTDHSLRPYRYYLGGTTTQVRAWTPSVGLYLESSVYLNSRTIQTTQNDCNMDYLRNRRTFSTDSLLPTQSPLG